MLSTIQFIAYIAFLVIKSVASQIREVLKEYVLNLKDEKEKVLVKKLRNLNELCKQRMVPISSALIEEVNLLIDEQWMFGDPRLLKLVLDMGLMHVIWVLLKSECMYGNHHSDLWGVIKQKQKAFDIVLDEYGDVEVATLLLKIANNWDIKSQWDKRRNTILHLLNDPQFDGIIFDMLEGEKESAVRSTSMEVEIDSQEERNAILEYYHNLIRQGLLGLNESNNTVLHLVSKIGNMNCVRYILEKDPSQMYCRNSDKETPAYVAAREGRIDILRFMINILKTKNEDIESIVTRNLDKVTVLHIAIQNHHVEVIFLLIQEIPQLANRLNESNQSPLYLAAERRYSGVVELILNKCKGNIAFDGPNGKNAVHAAAISDSVECLEYLLKENHDMLNVQDKRGWTPLHYAVHHNNSLATTKLLDINYAIGYQLILEDGKNTSAVHIAARLGHCETLRCFIDKCQGCSEFIDDKGRNILHVAIEHKKNEVIEFVFQDEALTSLINQKDKNGDTPIHLLVTSDFDFEKVEMLMDSRVDINALNNQKLTPLDMVPSDDQRKRLIKAISMGKRRAFPPKTNKNELNEIEWEAKINKYKANDKEPNSYFVVMDNLVLVATLIATASFAAGFTVPGGLDSNEVSKKPAFQTFIITNAIAFTSSCSVLLGHIALIFYRDHYDEASKDEQNYVAGKIADMYYLTTLALVAMIIAFVTCVYVLLTPSLGLAISMCVLCLLLITISMQYERFDRSGKSGKR